MSSNENCNCNQALRYREALEKIAKVEKQYSTLAPSQKLRHVVMIAENTLDEDKLYQGDEDE